MSYFADKTGFKHAGLVFICANDLRISTELINTGINLMYSFTDKALFDHFKILNTGPDQAIEIDLSAWDLMTKIFSYPGLSKPY